MTRETSIEAYHAIRDNGLLSNRRFEVYEYIALNGPCTINRMLADKAKAGRNTGSLTGRISELNRMNVIRECGYEIAPTGHRVTIWETTPDLPGELPKKETKLEAIMRLEQELRKLKIEYQDLSERYYELLAVTP